MSAVPVWLYHGGAWIALGGSLLFVVVGVAMHRVIRTVLQAPLPPREKTL